MRRRIETAAVLTWALLASAPVATAQEADDPAPTASDSADAGPPRAAEAQEDETPPAFLEGFRLYGSLRVQVAAYEKTFELQGNASRLGFRLTRDFFDTGVQVFGQVELGLSLLDNFADFNVRSSQGGLGRLEFGRRDDTIFGRLGFVGLDFGTYGILTAGKQWSTYYDVSGYTDNFFVFGGQASGTYPLGSDGGGLGTGRANKAVSYRNSLGGWILGVQAQVEANRLTGLGSLGGSLQYRFPFGLSLGVAGNFGDVPDEIVEQITGAKPNESAVVLGAKLDRPRLFLAATYSVHDGHDGRDVVAEYDPVTVVFDARGIEAFGWYDVSQWFRVSAGLNWLDPDPIPPLDPNFRIRNFVLGGAFYLNSQSLLYAEWKIEDSIDEIGQRVPSVLAVGLRLDFGLPEMQRNDSPPLRFPESDTRGDGIEDAEDAGGS